MDAFHFVIIYVLQELGPKKDKLETVWVHCVVALNFEAVLQAGSEGRGMTLGD